MSKVILPSDGRLSRLVEQLKKSGLRITEARIAILKSLFDKHGPFSAEEIYKKIKKTPCDVATIYRALSSLEKAEIVRRCEFGDGIARYELLEQEQNHHHHHVICRSCRKIEVLDDCELKELHHFAEKRGFTKITHSLEFFGICSKCNI